ncbi:MAG: hypothetical protein V4436_02290 [Patescibacteria group bacterium]
MNPRQFFVGRAIGLLAVLALVGVGYVLFQKPLVQPVVDSFEACVAAGNPVMESYPRQCRSREGVLFVEKISEPIAESWGTIMGTVMLGPTCPVMREPPDGACDDKPFETRLALTNADGSRVIKEFSSKSDGTFSIDVLPGDYAIRSAAAANILPYCSSNEMIRVRTNETTTADVSCDTGIR